MHLIFYFQRPRIWSMKATYYISQLTAYLNVIYIECILVFQLAADHSNLNHRNDRIESQLDSDWAVQTG